MTPGNLSRAMILRPQRSVAVITLPESHAMIHGAARSLPNEREKDLRHLKNCRHGQRGYGSFVLISRLPIRKYSVPSVSVLRPQNASRVSLRDVEVVAQPLKRQIASSKIVLMRIASLRRGKDMNSLGVGHTVSIESSWRENASNFWFLPKGRHLIIAESRRIRYPVPDRIRSCYEIARCCCRSWDGERFLRDELLTAIHAKLTPIHSSRGVRLRGSLGIACL